MSAWKTNQVRLFNLYPPSTPPFYLSYLDVSAESWFWSKRPHFEENRKAIDFGFIYDLVKDNTAKIRADPVVLFKIVFIQYLFGIRSMRQIIKEIEVNAAYRWFLGYDWNDPVPHFTTFGKNYSRRFEGTDIFEKIFARILLEAVELKYVDPKAVFIDSTHIKAGANRNKKMKVQVQEEAQHYQS